MRILVPCGGIRPPALAPACVVYAVDERASFVFVWIPQTAAACFVKTAYPVWVCLVLCVWCLPAPRTQLETEAGPQRICLTLDSGEALTDQGCLFLGTSALPHVLSRHLGFPHMLLSLATDFETSGNCSNCVSWVPDDRLGKIQNREIYLESYTCLWFGFFFTFSPEPTAQGSENGYLCRQHINTCSSWFVIYDFQTYGSYICMTEIQCIFFPT